jgi:hypothetical protein
MILGVEWDMANFMKVHITKIGVILPIIALVFGVIIINLSLNKYGIVEYSIFQIQSILTGSVYLVILYLLSVYFNWILSKFKHKLLLFIACLLSSIFITSVFYHLFIGEYHSNKLFNFTINPVILKSFLSLSFLSIICSLVYLDYIRSNDSKGNFFNGTRLRFVYVLLLFIILIFSYIFVIAISINLFIVSNEFKSIVWFFLPFSFFIMGIIIGINRDKTDKLNDKNNFSILNLNIYIIYFIFFLIYTTYLYASNVYPHIPKNYGGGKEEQANITYNNGLKLEGQVVHSNSNLIFIKQKDNIIKVIEWNKLESIERVR